MSSFSLSEGMNSMRAENWVCLVCHCIQCLLQQISIWVSFLVHNTGRDRENQAVTGLGASLGLLQTCWRRDTHDKQVAVNVCGGVALGWVRSCARLEKEGA